VTGSVVSPAMRQRVRDLATPIARGLGRLGLTPNALTVIGFLGTCVAAFAAANQWWLAAGVLVLVFGIFDLFDGALARATGQASRLGAFLDSTLDRAGESVVYVGIAAGSLAGGFQLGALLAIAALAASSLVPYARAKAEGLGFTPGSGMANIGLAPREVRAAILSVGLVATGLSGRAADCLALAADQVRGCVWGTHAGDGTLALTSTLGVIAILATLTTIQRILHVLNQAKEG
jgi:CDP-diacylglycerol--glycerol-3-phosphate 3-phosphatidyltransferase